MSFLKITMLNCCYNYGENCKLEKYNYKKWQYSDIEQQQTRSGWDVWCVIVKAKDGVCYDFMQRRFV